MQGSNKIGCDPSASVVSPHFRVWNTETGKEIPNLYVVDSSIFPTSVGANPMQTIYTIAKLWVDNFLKTFYFSDEINRSASSAAIQPAPAEVTAWR